MLCNAQRLPIVSHSVGRLALQCEQVANLDEADKEVAFRICIGLIEVHKLPANRQAVIEMLSRAGKVRPGFQGLAQPFVSD